MSYLLRQGYIQKGKHITDQLSWTNGSTIRFESVYTNDEAFIRLSYRSTDSETNETSDFDYKIYLAKVPSNLGQGDVLYFVCPVTYRRCRILYKCYGSKIWRSRYAYSNQIYYSCQTSSKKGYFDDRYWTLERKLAKTPIPVKTHYKGCQTKPQRRVGQLEEQLSYYDEMRWISLDQEIHKYLSKY